MVHASRFLHKLISAKTRQSGSLFPLNVAFVNVIGGVFGRTIVNGPPLGYWNGEDHSYRQDEKNGRYNRDAEDHWQRHDRYPRHKKIKQNQHRDGSRNGGNGGGYNYNRRSRNDNYSSGKRRGKNRGSRKPQGKRGGGAKTIRRPNGEILSGSHAVEGALLARFRNIHRLFCLPVVNEKGTKPVGRYGSERDIVEKLQGELDIRGKVLYPEQWEEEEEGDESDENDEGVERLGDNSIPNHATHEDNRGYGGGIESAFERISNNELRRTTGYKDRLRIVRMVRIKTMFCR